MPTRFCKHLEEYEVQYVKAEASYRALLAVLDQALAGDDPGAMAGTLSGALGEWQKEAGALREMFLDLYQKGRILLPPRRTSRSRRAPSRPRGRAKCSGCFREIPRLELVEWQFAHNGTVNYKGQELNPAPPAPIPA